MTKKEALDILENHQKWRLGDDEVEATNPKELSNALDLAIECLKSSSWRKVSEELPDKSCEVLVKDSMVDMYIAYFSYGKFQLDRYVQISGDIIEWKPID